MASSSQNPPAKYDVFISFRGEDVRHGLLSHLKKELKQKGINAFVDDRLVSGDEISSSLVRAIEESDSSLVIFSENYASSKWCLEELVKIMDCMKRRKQIVTPVFYNINPSDVRHQKASYGAAFAKHDVKYKEKVQSWRSALHDAANLSGFHYSKFSGLSPRDEAELVEKVAKSLLTKLKAVYSHDSKNHVGIKEMVTELESLMNQESKDVQVIGIWGMGGIGKTTLAATLFYQFYSEYDGYCFMANVREECKRNGIIYLMNKMFSALLKENDSHIETTEVPPLVKRKLHQKKVLLVLDDIDDSHEDLVGALDYFSPSSRIIITTRNKQVLNKRFYTYEVKPLMFDEALELFIMNAFKEKGRDMEWISLSEKVIKYAKGLPLALKVLGSFLRGKSKEEWRSQLRKLEINTFSKINQVLKLSYDGLDDPQRQVFLHIACCLRGHYRREIIALLDACDFSTASELKVLQDKALIECEWEKVSMHDLIHDMGKEIVCEESRNPGERSRLWNAKDICKVFQHNMGTKNIESISLDTKELSEDLDLDPRVFSRMQELKFLKIYNFNGKHVHLSKGLESLPNELRLLHWYFYPLKYLPSTFCPKNLVELYLWGSALKRLWDKDVEFGNLRMLDLSYSKDLSELPDLSSAKNLEEVQLKSCENLCVIHPSIFSLPKLTKLNLSECKRLTCLRNDTPFKSLKSLWLTGCSRLEEFSVISKTLTFLSLSNTALKEFPSPGSLGSLHLPCLTMFYITDCIELRSLLDLPPSIEALYTRNCKSLEIVQFSSMVDDRRNKELLEIDLQNCMKLDEKSRNAIELCAHHKLRNHVLYYAQGEDVRSSVMYPGSKVPEWFEYMSSQGSITMDTHSNLLGFIFCQILHGDEPLRVRLFLETNNGQMDLLGEIDEDLWLFDVADDFPEPNSYHVYLYYDCDFCADIIEKMKERKESNQQKSYHSKLLIQFGMKENEMKDCGVYPIYALEESTDDEDDEDIEGLEALPPSKRLKQFHVNSTASTSNLGYNNAIEELMDLEIDNNNNINSDDQYLSLELESRVRQLQMEFASCIN